MSEDKKTVEDQKDAAAGFDPDATSTIIDAEIIEEQDGPTSSGPTASGPTASGPTASGSASGASTKGSSGSKVGWITAALLAAFIIGIYYQPKFEAQMISLGLMKASTAAQSPPQDTPQDKRNTDKLERQQAAFDQRLSTLTSRLERLEVTRPSLEKDLTAIETALEGLRGDLTLLAGETAGGQTIGAGGSEAIAALNARVSEAEAQIAALGTLAATPSENITRLEGALAIARAENKKLQDQITQIAADIQQLRSQKLSENPRGRIVLALGQVRSLMDAGKNFKALLSGLNPDFDTLPPYVQGQMASLVDSLKAKAGQVDRFDKLRDDFAGVAAQLKKADVEAAGGLLSSLFTVRRTDDQAEGIDKQLAEAEQFLAGGDLRAAVHSLSALQGEAQSAAAAWLDRADKRLKAYAELDQIVALVAGDV